MRSSPRKGRPPGLPPSRLEIKRKPRTNSIPIAQVVEQVDSNEELPAAAAADEIPLIQEMDDVEEEDIALDGIVLPEVALPALPPPEDPNVHNEEGGEEVGGKEVGGARRLAVMIF